MKTGKQLMLQNVIKDNQVVHQILGICSLLAVTNLMSNSLVMGLGLTFSTACSSFTISLIRRLIPNRIRMMIQVLIIASYVILFDIILQAFLPEVSRALGPYVGLIITNCIIMGRAEAYAQKNPPILALLDGLFAGLGYTLVLLLTALVREALGFGTIFGYNINFIGFETWTLMVMPPAAFFLTGTLIWIVNYAELTKRHKDLSSQQLGGGADHD
jgi:Na+-transporting NADH:ubiquinone oxidoreductase subunit D